MPQVFQVLKCYRCSVFQIHQTKKSNKFECKMCREKQSIKRHYGIGTGKDCRMHVQKLNVIRGNIQTKTTAESNSDEEYENSKIDGIITENNENLVANHLKPSKWSSFIEDKKDTEKIEEPMFLGDKEVVLEMPNKAKIRKIKVKVKAKNAEDKSYSIDSTSKDNLKCDIELSSNFDSDTFEPVQSPIQYKIFDKSSCATSKMKLTSNVKEKASEKPVVLQTVNKNSKWAQYIDEEDYKDSDSSSPLSHHDSKECVTSSENLFSLCDDNDLDKVLDI